MKCPVCGSNQSLVIDSRPEGIDSTTRRRRECKDCGCKYTTYEMTDETYKKCRELYDFCKRVKKIMEDKR